MPASQKASDNPFPSLLIDETAAASIPTPASGEQRVFIDTADNELKRKSSSGTVTPIEADVSAADLATHETDVDAHHAKYTDAEAQAAVAGSVKLDDLAAPDDNTDLDATTSRHGLLPKLPGGTTDFLRADGTYAAPPGGGGSGDSIVRSLTNKSGGSVAAGDVVVLDSANDSAFTTTTTGHAEVTVGIAQETIANDAAGAVLLAGYAALVNVDAAVTRGHYLETHTTAKEATGSATRRAGSFGQFLTDGATPSAVLWGQTDQAAGGAIAVQDGSGTNSEDPADTLIFPDGTVSPNGDGSVNVREVPTGVVGCAVTKSGTQSVNDSTDTTVTFDSEDFDTDGFHDNSTNSSRVTIPAGMGGKYLAVFTGVIDDAAAGSREAKIVKNGVTTIERVGFNENSGRWTRFQMSGIVELAAGDYIEVVVWQDSGGTRDIEADTRLELIKLGSGTVGEAIGAKATLSSAQTLTASTGAVIAFDQTTFDTDGLVNAGTGVFTIPAGLGGKWLAVANVALEDTVGAYPIAQVRVNSSLAFFVRRDDGTDVNWFGSGSDVLNLEPGDTVDLFANPGDASADVREDASSLSLVLLATQGSSGVNLTDNVRILSGSGTPESNVAAVIGSMYLRTDGGASTTLYVKESGTGSTGWAAK